MKKRILLIFFITSLTYAQPYPGFRVQGRYLYDRYGERVILRGANAMIVFWDREGKVNYPELAKTGANCCRIFWMTGHDPEPVMPASDLDKTLQNCIATN
jgi:mannan endo-1,4-beta-mannosidase